MTEWEDIVLRNTVKEFIAAFDAWEDREDGWTTKEVEVFRLVNELRKLTRD